MDQSEKQKPHWLKIVFDSTVIVVMVIALIAALMANKTSRDANKLAFEANETSRVANKLAFESLRSPYIPWLKVVSMEPPAILDSNHFEINFYCKNFSNAPALNLDIKYNLLGSGETISSQTTSYDTVALLPNEKHHYRLTYQDKIRRSKS